LNVTDIINSIREDYRAKILVVDDDRGILDVVREILLTQDYDVVLAQSLNEGKKVIREQQVSIVLTDLMLDVGSGFDVIEEVQAHQPDSKIILMTGKPTIQNAISVIKKGAFDYLVKPFDLENLLNTVDRAVKQLKLEHENVRLNEIMSIYKITEAMGSVIQSDKLLNLILDTVMREFIGDYAALHLGDDSGILNLVKYRSLRSDITGRLNSAGQKIAESVYYSSKPKLIKQSNDQSLYRTAICQPLMSKGVSIGTISLIRINEPRQFTKGQLSTLSLFAGKAAISLENSKLYNDLEESYFKTVEVLANSIEARDQYTAGHTSRVWQITHDIAKSFDWDQQKLKELRMGSILHDIGKIGVPDAILNKKGSLTSNEFSVMRTHPELGAHIIRQIKFLNPALPYILYHHERFDGKGYPSGLKAEDIPIEGRLLAVVDTYDAITSDRPYRKGRSRKEAITEIKNHAGTQFDPIIVKAFLKIINSNSFNDQYAPKRKNKKDKNQIAV